MAKCNQLTALPFKGLTLSPPIPLRLYSTLCHTGLSHHFFLIFVVRALWCSHYGTEPFEQQQFGTAGVEGIKNLVVD